MYSFCFALYALVSYIVALVACGDMHAFVCVRLCGCSMWPGPPQVREEHPLVDAVAKLAVHCVAGNPRARPSARVLVALLESALLTHGVPLSLPGSKPVAPIDDIGESMCSGVVERAVSCVLGAGRTLCALHHVISPSHAVHSMVDMVQHAAHPTPSCMCPDVRARHSGPWHPSPCIRAPAPC